MDRLFILVMLLACLLAALPQSRAQDARGTPNAPKVGTFGNAVTRYYEAPSDVAWLLADWEQAGGPSRNVMMGFLAGLFD